MSTFWPLAFFLDNWILFSFLKGENECECEGCHEHDPKEQRSDDEVLFKNLRNVIKSNADKIKSK